MAASSISPRASEDYPTLREAIAAGALMKLAEEARAAFAGSCARRDQLAAADPRAGKDHLHRRQLSGPQRRIQGRPGRAEISEHVHAHAALLCRPQHAAGAPARLGAARLRGRTGARHRQGRPAHPGERRRSTTSPRSRCATRARIRDWVRHAKFNVTQGKNFDSTGSLGPVARALHRSQRRSPTSA